MYCRPRATGSNGQAFGNPYQYVFQQNEIWFFHLKVFMKYLKQEV